MSMPRTNVFSVVYLFSQLPPLQQSFRLRMLWLQLVRQTWQAGEQEVEQLAPLPQQLGEAAMLPLHLLEEF